MMYHDTRMSLLIHGEYVEEADMNLTGNGRCIAAIGSVVTACVLVLSGCGGGGDDDGTKTDSKGTTETSTSNADNTSETDDTTTLTRPSTTASTTATTIENSP